MVLFHELNYEIVKGMRVNREKIMLGLNFINPLIRILRVGLRIPIINRQHHSCPNEVEISIVSFNH